MNCLVLLLLFSKIFLHIEVSSQGLLSLITSPNQSGSQTYINKNETKRLNFKKSFNFGQTSDILCPASCQCYISEVAQCTHANLNDIPCDFLSIQNQVYQNVFSLHLRDLYLSYNHINEIPRECLRVSGREIHSLSLQHNIITRIDDDAFMNLNSLEVLDLSSNRLLSLVHQEGSNRSTSVFDGISGTLRSLYLSNNAINSVPENSFSRFQSLHTLSLSHNQIRWVSRRAFQDLTSLKILQIRGNPLYALAASRFSLSILWFSNRYRQLPTIGVFTANVSTTRNQTSNTVGFIKEDLHDDATKVHRSSNKSNYYYRNEDETLTTLDLGQLGLTSVPLGFSKILKIIYLDHNQISRIESFDFSELYELHYLYLSHNKIENISSEAFTSLINLHTLDLSFNNLFWLSPDGFHSLQNLYSLRLHNNPTLTQLPTKLFKHNQRLNYLYLQDCGLQSLPHGLWLHKLTALWLYGNPLTCSCTTVIPLLVRLKYRNSMSFNAKFFFDMFNKEINDGDVWEYLRNEQSRCAHPRKWLGRPLKNFTFTEILCSPQEWAELITNMEKADPVYETYDDPLYEIPTDENMGVLNSSLQQPYDNSSLETTENMSLDEGDLLNEFLLNYDTPSDDKELYDDMRRFLGVDDNYYESDPEDNKELATSSNPNMEMQLSENNVSSHKNDVSAQTSQSNGNVINGFFSPPLHDTMILNSSSSSLNFTEESLPSTSTSLDSTRKAANFSDNSLLELEYRRQQFNDFESNLQQDEVSHLVEDDFNLYESENLTEEYWQAYNENYMNMEMLENNSSKRESWWEVVTNEPAPTSKYKHFKSDLDKWLNGTQLRLINKLLEAKKSNSLQKDYTEEGAITTSFSYNNHVVYFNNLADPNWEEIET